MDGIETVARHFGYILGEYACGVDDYLRADNAPVGRDGDYLAVPDFHARHGGVKRHLSAVHHGVLAVGYRQPVGANAARHRVVYGEFEITVKFRLAALQLRTRNDGRIVYAVDEFSLPGV